MYIDRLDIALLYNFITLLKSVLENYPPMGMKCIGNRWTNF